MGAGAAKDAKPIMERFNRIKAFIRRMVTAVKLLKMESPLEVTVKVLSTISDRGGFPCR